MKAIQIGAGLMLVASILILALAVIDFLALHDIRHEYISLEIIDSLGIRLSTELPAWTATAGEWAVVQFSYVARLAFVALNIVMLSVVVFFVRRQARGKRERA